MKNRKDNSKKPFWENEYLNKEKSPFGNPSKEVEEIVSLLPEGARILDVGCGDGRNRRKKRDVCEIRA